MKANCPSCGALLVCFIGRSLSVADLLNFIFDKFGNNTNNEIILSK